MKDSSSSSLTRGCSRTPVVAGASSSASSTASKRRKVSSSSSGSELACCALFTASAEKVKAPSSPAASPLRCSFSSDLPPALSAPASSFDSGVVVEDDGLFVGDQRQEKSSETESSTCNNGNFSREATPSSELCHENTKRMEPQANNNQRTQEPVAAGRSRVKPPQAEIEEFFSAAEKYEQNRFMEKYNYDIVKDAPLQGRYQWVRLKP